MAKKETPSYEEEKANNERIFYEALKNMRGDIWVLMDLLDKTGINYYVVFQLIRALNNIAIGNKYGTVTAYIENGVVTFVRGEESVKLNEQLVLQRPEK